MLEIQGSSFLLDGKKFNIYSGAIHYFRTLPEYWEDRLTKLKLAGFNTVETYVSWNLHEPKKGEFNFDGMLDIERFVQTATKVGLQVIVRPGPYICAEWDFGGLPAWLLKDKNLYLRCNDTTFLQHVKDFYTELLGRLDKYQSVNGGNIIAMQIENEYGSYGNDKQYLAAIEKIMIDCGVKVLMFTSDGDSDFFLSGGTLPHVYKVLNFGSGAGHAFNCLKNMQPDAPKMCGEFWCGWFDHWGEKHHVRNSLSVVSEINSFIKQDANFNIYMFHGGTNFGFNAGANYNRKYAPTTTSYDYSAFLTEYGDYTPAYHAVRKVLHEKQGLEMLPLPNSPKLQNIGAVKLDKQASLLDNVKLLGEHHKSAATESMESYGQNFGLIMYHTEIKGNYGVSIINFEGVHDIAYLYIDGELKKTYYRMKNGKGKFGDGFSILVPNIKGSMTIDLLIEGMGRVNYGKKIIDRKGVERVSIGNQIIYDWDVYTMPMDNLDKLNFALTNSNTKCPIVLKGTFKCTTNDDCFVDMRGFDKGFVIVNGFNLGRYWKVGPQRTLYLPGTLLKVDGDNEIIVVEQEGYKTNSLNIIDKHILK